MSRQVVDLLIVAGGTGHDEPTNNSGEALNRPDLTGADAEFLAGVEDDFKQVLAVRPVAGDQVGAGSF